MSTRGYFALGIRTERVLAVNHADQDRDYREYEEQMDEPADCVDADNTEEPQNEKNDSNGYQHEDALTDKSRRGSVSHFKCVSHEGRYGNSTSASVFILGNTRSHVCALSARYFAPSGRVPKSPWRT